MDHVGICVIDVFNVSAGGPTTLYYSIFSAAFQVHSPIIVLIFGEGVLPGKFYPAIAQNDRLLSHKNSSLIHMCRACQLLSHNFETHIVLGSAHPNHAFLMQMLQMGKIHV